MKLGKYILGLALVAVGLTSCEKDNVGAIFEPTQANISFIADEQSKLTDQTSIEVPVALGRAITKGTYTATLSIVEADEGVTLKSDKVTFADGEGMAYATVVVTNMKQGNSYGCTLTLSDEDVATANTKFGEQINTTYVEVMCDYNWVSAGYCTVVDGWYTEMFSAEEVPVMNAEGTNVYRLLSPLYYVYVDSEVDPSQTCDADLEFILNQDGSIKISEGTMPLYYMDGSDKYYGYFTSDYPSYCFIEQDGNTYALNFLFLNGSDLHTGGYFEFTWFK